MDLAALGWDEAWAGAFEAVDDGRVAPGRVAAEHQHIYRVYTGAGEVMATVAGRIRHRAAGRRDFPAVGDWVCVRGGARDARARIERVLPRRTLFSRKVAGSVTDEQPVAANVDEVFLVSALDADFNLRRLERYLVLAGSSGARPVIVLNKADLCPDVPSRLREVEAIAPGIRVHVLSSLTGEGLERLQPYLRRGRTVALLGSSGVGKSTIINRLAGGSLLRTAGVRASDRRGRHTTTHRELVVLPDGGMLIDTPGMRELQLWEAPAAARDTFEEIEELAQKCHFHDCRHLDEPRCAVKQAVADGRLPVARLASYHKLQEELRRLAQRQRGRRRE